jgi:hypothetical protein
VATKCVLEASSRHAANDCEVAEREGLVCVCKNELFNRPNLPGGNIPFGSIHKLRIVVSQSLQDEGDERPLNLPRSLTRLCEFRLSCFFVKLHEHSFYGPSRTMFEVHHGVKIYRANNLTLNQVRQFNLNRARRETSPEYVPILVRSNLNRVQPWPECAAGRSDSAA